MCWELFPSPTLFVSRSRCSSHRGYRTRHCVRLRWRLRRPLPPCPTGECRRRRPLEVALHRRVRRPQVLLDSCAGRAVVRKADYKDTFARSHYTSHDTLTTHAHRGVRQRQISAYVQFARSRPSVCTCCIEFRPPRSDRAAFDVNIP
ncbi:uncharacterized protein LOC113228784 [Hyposmocoma kahamanoa]|uniref:uncharacterized protein LOC113228784 n=1 Tax=Hyposmocoma kahamanoa TaxID=1477025 RepID=UPI000E6D8155|nr:uncharacterized protein LOC113228784 [Hyposmocoma kahamanoa]